MDFSGIPMVQDRIDSPNPLSYDSFASSDKWTDHVKWQGSQTACQALNQLIKSSVNEEAAQEGPRISGWQRVSSYDQLPSLHSTTHHDTASNSSLLPSHSRPSSKPSSSSRPHSRARLSEARTPASDPTILDLPNPLFNKTNPMQFLDIMKGVSARLDENAGFRPRKEPGPGSGSSCFRAKKRIRGVSLGPEFQTGNRGSAKKGRVDELRWDEGRREIKSTSEDDGLLHSEMRGRNLQAHNSWPDITSRLDLRRGISSKDGGFMDVDERDDMNLEHASLSSSSNHNYPDTRSFAITHSQTEMPPPPFVSDSFVHKQHQSAAADSPLQQPISTPFAVSRHSNSINKPRTSYPPQQQPPSTSHCVKQRKSDAIPKLHPLLYQKPATTTTTRVSSSSIATAPPVQTQHRHVPIPVPDLKPPQPSLTSTPTFSSTPSSRPPPLGMRRNHTFPSRTSSSSTIQQESSSPSLAGGQLPQRLKGFKSPLLSLSQPQVQTRMHSHSQLKPNANVIAIESGSTTATSKKASSSLNSPEASRSDNHGFNTTSGNSMALGSSSSSSSSFSDSSFRFTPPIKSSVSSCSHSNPPGYSSSQKSNRGVTQHVQQEPQESVIIPEPSDGDPDSSFGDMSFDMDALEETMKMYD